jgi:gamma-glutamylcyclotransferase (GGCT)/AIG2-like uncharacterized protein YtfP
MTDLVFFYGTLMSGFQRPGRARLDDVLRPRGRGWIQATLFDLGIYPAAIPAELDEIEGYRPDEPDTSLYTRQEVPVTFEDGRMSTVWTYFYNAPLGQAQRIDSGDYLEHLKVK